ALQLLLLAAAHEELLLGEPGPRLVLLVHRLEHLEPLDRLVHSREVRMHAAQPPLVHVRHADPRRLLGDGLLRLLLRPDEEDGPAVRDGLLDELVRTVDVGKGLLQVDDVDPVALREDEALHLRVPPTGLVAEVDAALELLRHGDDRRHVGPSIYVPAGTPAVGLAGSPHPRPYARDGFRRSLSGPRRDPTGGRANWPTA